MRVALLLAVAGVAWADISALVKVREKMMAAGGTADAQVLSEAAEALMKAEQQCSADGDGAAEGRAIAQVREGYETLGRLLAAKPADISKLEKVVAKKTKIKDAAYSEATSDEELVPKDEKAELEATLKKATAA